MDLDQATTLILLGRNLDVRAKGRASEAIVKLLERGAMLATATSLPK